VDKHIRAKTAINGEAEGGLKEPALKDILSLP